MSSTPPPPWAVTILSRPRLAVYLTAAGGDGERALELHAWNIRLSHALLADLTLVELALRNALAPRLERIAEDRSLGTWYSPDAVSVLFPGSRHQRSRSTIAEAVRRAGGLGQPPGRVVAELTFGFWTHLLDARNEGTLWDGGLSNAFPSDTDRERVRVVVDALCTARNRIGHHEPMFNRDPMSIHRRGVWVAKLFDREFATYLRTMSTVAQVLAQRP